MEIEGDGSVNVIRGDESFPAEPGTLIQLGDRVETDPGVKCKITFIDDTEIAIGENYSLTIDEYVYDPATESGATNFSVLRGVFVFGSGLISRE